MSHQLKGANQGGPQCSSHLAVYMSNRLLPHPHSPGPLPWPPQCCLLRALWGPTWFSVAGWHSSNRIPNALGAAFLFFLIMLMPQGVLGAATLSSGMNSDKESEGQLTEVRRVPHIQCHTHTLGHRDFIKELGRLKGERRLSGQGDWSSGRRPWLMRVVGGLKVQPVR